MAAAGLAISLLLPGLGFGQATEAKNESQSNAGDALIPLTSDPPLTAREEEMLRLIKGLQERVARLEAQDGSGDGDVKPAVTGASQARLLEASIVSLPPARVNGATGTATLPGVSGAAIASATIKNPFDKHDGQDAPKTWGTYTPNFGFKLVNTEYGDVNLSIYSYARYLNQRNLQPTYTSAFGVTTTLQQRQDFQLQKVQIKFLGWVMSPKFRYFLYAWTSNASMGLPAQVVLAGNLSYTFNKYLTVTAGIMSLPGTRSVEGNFPFWLSVDSRLIADEFFRPSYTDGVRASGTLRKGLIYQSMIGDNNSVLGVSAAQLPNYFKTTANALVWMPTTGEFGQGWGDFENHQKLATRLAGHFSYSKEDAQEQPNTEAFENTQLRLSDGSIIFTPNLFGPGISVKNAVYKMASIDFGLKYHGYALEGEYYPLHKLSNFQGTGTSGLRPNSDYGYQLQLSAMAIQKTLQGYLGGSEVIGNYGRPFDFRAGINYFPFKNRVVRWNTEFLYTYRSPVGYTSVPFAFGGTGPIFYTNLEMAF